MFCERRANRVPRKVLLRRTRFCGLESCGALDSRAGTVASPVDSSAPIASWAFQGRPCPALGHHAEKGHGESTEKDDRDPRKCTHGTPQKLTQWALSWHSFSARKMGTKLGPLYRVSTEMGSIFEAPFRAHVGGLCRCFLCLLRRWARGCGRTFGSPGAPLESVSSMCTRMKQSDTKNICKCTKICAKLTPPQ